jgi:FixJ family two-component response regulator
LRATDVQRDHLVLPRRKNPSLTVKIAQALVISERTAAVHVERILRKLDLHSRWQVVESVAALGLLTSNP